MERFLMRCKVIFLTTALFTGCKKEYSYEGGYHSVADYVLVSGPAGCSGAVEGSYTSGTPITTENAYSLEVYVEKTGQFSISTNTVAGLYFTGMGTFVKTGNQVVRLVAVGIPNSIGNFTITPQIDGSTQMDGNACDFLLSVK